MGPLRHASNHSGVVAGKLTNSYGGFTNAKIKMTTGVAQTFHLKESIIQDLGIFDGTDFTNEFHT